jgi:hypothetical protein
VTEKLSLAYKPLQIDKKISLKPTYVSEECLFIPNEYGTFCVSKILAGTEPQSKADYQISERVRIRDPPIYQSKIFVSTVGSLG